MSSSVPTGDATAPRTGRSLLLPALVMAVALALAVAALTGDDPSDETSTTQAPAESDSGQPADAAEGADPQDRDGGSAGGHAATPADLERRDEGDPMALGDVDAPVVLIEWSDFQCPFCQTFARDVKPELIGRYVDDGVLRIEWRDFPVLGEESVTAALAGRAAAEQDAFWELHDELFAEDRPRNAGELAPERLVDMADDLGLDAQRFAADFEDPALAEAARADSEQGQALGFSSTPSFVINGTAIIGAQPIEVFVDVIEQAAEEALTEGGQR